MTGNPGVASVDMLTGEATAIAQGTTEITATAGGQTDVVTVNVAFEGGNSDPVLTLDAETVADFTTPVTPFTAATVSDPTQASFMGGTLTVADSAAPSSTVITLPATPNIGTITANGSSSVSVALTASATPAAVQQVLRGATVSGVSSPVSIEVGVNDGLGGSGEDAQSMIPTGIVLSGTHTFDTTTGLFDGISTPFAGGVITTNSFDLQSGASLRLNGSNPFELNATSGDVIIAGTLDASGNGSTNPGPGGFPGGAGSTQQGVAGESGGGAVRITASGMITFTGLIDASGADGANSPLAGGGGGGSGGVVELLSGGGFSGPGGGIMDVSGGSGGRGVDVSTSPPYPFGGAGAAGRTRTGSL